MSNARDQDTNDQNPQAEEGAGHPVPPGHPQGVSLLEVRGLSGGYGETQVLWDISLEVMRGEVVALVGANGAGKSTLLAVLSGLLPAWEGSHSVIVFAGRDITRYRAERIVQLGLVQVPQ